MTRRLPETKFSRQTRFENLEERLVLTASGLLESGLQPETQIDSSTVEITTMTAGLTPAEEANAIVNNYGFDGKGQTIAVIDTGIAWDHYALGGGYGEGHRVVGGWDFAENDANPYDDGPAGYHGTHVAGIIGSTDSEHRGIASGADLVALRVFDDSGNSQFRWIEEALQWVHDHRNDFANPITTVNLSLGTAYNTDAPPNWSILEEEFAQLEADGIFISVAAGNSFQQFLEPGLSYPASSSSVVPIASHDADGSLSDFSQRNDRVLVAPGRDIQSTVPDHLFGGTASGQFLRASGTSMAAPYVAGASAVLRDAYQFMGIGNVTQDQLYSIFRDSAEVFYDSATQANYHRVNLQSAIDAIIGDLHGDTFGQATELGTVLDNTSVEGRIGAVSDVDAFQFTAGKTGVATLEIEATHQLVQDWNLNGLEFEVDGNQIHFDVQAGQEYRFSLTTNDGIGHYEINLAIDDSIQAIDLGTIVQQRVDNVLIDGQQWMSLTASKTGFMTVSAEGLPENAQLGMEVYNGAMERVSASQGNNGSRLDFKAVEGEKYFVKLIGDNLQTDFTLTNLVSLDEGVLDIDGTSRNDVISIVVGNDFLVHVNGVRYQLSGQVDEVVVSGNQGADRLYFAGDSHDDRLTSNVGNFQLVSENYTARGQSLEEIFVDSGGGDDRAVLNDSAGNDRFDATYRRASLRGSQFFNQVTGYQRVEATASAGSDRAFLHGSSGSDWFIGRQTESLLRSQGREMVASQFESVRADGGNGGWDVAQLYDSTADDLLVIHPRHAEMWGNNAHYKAFGFRSMYAYASEGNDRVVFYDSVVDDRYISMETHSTLRSGHFFNYAEGFETATARSIRGGNDRAYLYGTVGDDVAQSFATYSFLQSASHLTRAESFSSVVLRGDQGGNDQVSFFGTYANERFVVQGRVGTMAGDGFEARAFGFNQIDVYGNGGDDRVVLDDLNSPASLAGTGSEIDAVLDDLRMSFFDFDSITAHNDHDEAGSYEFNAVDYLFNLHGNWQAT